MTVLHAVDITVVQTFAAVESVVTFSYLSNSSVGLTYAECVAVGNDFILEVLPALNLCQHDGIVNTKLEIQARGTTTPKAELGLLGGGGYAAATNERMIPSMAFWYRFVTGATEDSNTGDPDTTHPVKWGGVHVPGPTEDYWDDGVFTFPLGQDDAWADLETALGVSLSDGGHTFEHAVLGEQIVSGTGWRIAPVQGWVINRIGEVKSRRS